ncbi:MAG: hypothetical protein WD492_02865 [Alkalispirochaeta sp.]
MKKVLKALSSHTGMMVLCVAMLAALILVPMTNIPIPDGFNSLFFVAFIGIHLLMALGMHKHGAKSKENLSENAIAVEDSTGRPERR